MRSFKEIIKEAKRRGPFRLVLAASQDEETRKAIKRAEEEGIVRGILIEDKGEEAASKAVELVRNGEADLIMKGALTTAQFMHPILDKEKGLTTGRLLSHVAVFEGTGTSISKPLLEILAEGKADTFGVLSLTG